jgi:D-lactate dehydrogenase
MQGPNPYNDTAARPAAAPATSANEKAYRSLRKALRGFIPKERLFTDPLRLLAYGTDASLYRLVPKLVVRATNEAEVRGVLAACRERKLPVTFRAAGTSLAGQAITDSVLVVMGDGWQGIDVLEGGAKIRLQPGVIGSAANKRLAPLGRKIGPDPASIDSAMIGGIAANNASGMCCGTHENSYQTLDSMRMVFADGTVLDTADQQSRAAFAQSHKQVLDGIADLARRTRADQPLAERIRRKFRIKNTTGYALNALVDYDEPIDILQHLLIGSEGTLAFISELTYRTVIDLPAKASCLAVFPDIGEACRTVAALKTQKAPVAAVELLDSPAMRAMEKQPNMPDQILGTPDGAAALLIETRALDSKQLADNIEAINKVMGSFRELSPHLFTADTKITSRYWSIRKGVFPVVAAVRPPGTTVIIEDVAFRIEDLAQAVLDLQKLLENHGYQGAVIYGHALDGNMHFVIFQDFSSDAEIERYRKFLDAVAELVVDKYDGSLKAEHGTGRNMAPFVEKEWGKAAYKAMAEIKALLDPENLLNPGVILNDDPNVHLKHFKPMPAASKLIDTCMECGFCESQCPSNGMTLTPRQRIAGLRELARLDRSGEEPARLEEMRKRYTWDGTRTCAACGLCSTVCPMGINTGKMMKHLRAEALGGAAHSVGEFAADHYGGMLSVCGVGLGTAGAVQKVIGDKAFNGLAAGARAATFGLVPKVTSNLPGRVSFTPVDSTQPGTRVVYVPSCATRSMGPSASDPVQDSVPAVFQKLLEKAGIAVVYPKGMDGLCCGQAWETLGLQETADAKAAEFEKALREASEDGKLPILFDTSTCSYKMRDFMKGRLQLQDVIEVLHDLVLPRLPIVKKKEVVMLHINCGAKKMGLEPKLVAVAKACAEKVVQPEGMTCCGFAGTWGFHTPELNEHATRKLHVQVPHECHDGYSTNRTCEIGLADQAGVPYRSLVHLVAEATGTTLKG